MDSFSTKDINFNSAISCIASIADAETSLIHLILALFFIFLFAGSVKFLSFTQFIVELLSFGLPGVGFPSVCCEYHYLIKELLWDSSRAIGGES